MADKGGGDHGGGGDKQKMTPATLFLFLLAAGIGIYILLWGMGMGIEAFGMAKRRYPEVVMGFLFLIIIGLIAGASMAKKKAEGGGH